MEYIVICAAIAFALGVGLSGGDSELARLLDAFRTAYRRFSFSLSLPS